MDKRHLAAKYSSALSGTEHEMADTENKLQAMLSDLTESDADMAGIRELRRLPGGEKDG